MMRKCVHLAWWGVALAVLRLAAYALLAIEVRTSPEGAMAIVLDVPAFMLFRLLGRTGVLKTGVASIWDWRWHVLGSIGWFVLGVATAWAVRRGRALWLRARGM